MVITHKIKLRFNGVFFNYDFFLSNPFTSNSILYHVTSDNISFTLRISLNPL